jgi:uncharacterized protein (DUF2062 family)
LLLLSWLGVMGGLAARGFFDAFFTQFPLPLALALLPPWIALIGCIAVPALRTSLTVTPLAWLIGYQTFRVGVEYVLWLLSQQGHMPHAMTVEGQNIDLLVGITAPACRAAGRSPASLDSASGTGLEWRGTADFAQHHSGRLPIGAWLLPRPHDAAAQHDYQ